MQARRKKLQELGAGAVFIAHDEPERLARGILDGVELVFPFGIDIERRSYRDWGLRRVSPLRLLLDPPLWLAYARLLLGGGERWRPRGRDALQLGGDFVVAPDGRVAYSRPQVKDDRPPVGELLRELERAAAGGASPAS